MNFVNWKQGTNSIFGPRQVKRKYCDFNWRWKWKCPEIYEHSDLNGQEKINKSKNKSTRTVNNHKAQNRSVSYHNNKSLEIQHCWGTFEPPHTPDEAFKITRDFGVRARVCVGVVFLVGTSLWPKMDYQLPTQNMSIVVDNSVNGNPTAQQQLQQLMLVNSCKEDAAIQPRFLCHRCILIRMEKFQKETKNRSHSSCRYVVL